SPPRHHRPLSAEYERFFRFEAVLLHLFETMDEASPPSLTDLCMTLVSSRLELFCEMRDDGSLSFREPLVFPQELADQLLCKMATEGLLNDSTVGIFRSCQQFRLRHACIRTARISAEAFHRALCLHRLVELDASRVNADLTIADILRGLSSSKTLQESLQRLVLNGLTMSSLEEPSCRCFSAMKGLRALSVSSVDFYDSGLVDVCTLPRLESLDISNTSVTNLTPLLGLRSRLRYLTMHQLKRLEMTTAQLLAVLSQEVDFSHQSANYDFPLNSCSVPPPQLQKNCLLSLCSDRILQEVLFNRFEAAKLVMQWLCNHEDQNMQRMAVAIISILAAKLSTEQTAQLGAELFIVKQLLHIVRQKTCQGIVDATLKFTLSALWNLTDESPTTCRHFIENQGLELFIKVLESFPSESSIQQKILGLLVRNSGGGQNPEVEVSYFAAGILAHLTSRGEKVWTLDLSLRTTLLEQLHSAILKWPSPECEMVAYRSFNPFFPLLECFQTPGVQLWAAWAMQHVCSKNAGRYCSMLLEEGGLQQLEAMRSHPKTHSDVLRLAESILDSLHHHKARTGYTGPPKIHAHREKNVP
ncbi:protein zyg-11 homolog, partial [Sinocyclocheilus grahami]|uniref:protein zyg-11 homolog n=1 Tax=Sinocyclocheilus grahami TaxID=75366 RepID=UPI0007ACD315